MQSKKITDTEVRSLKVSSLPTRPTAPAAFGGSGYSANEMKAAFDRFPEFLLEKLNLLIDDLTKEGDESYVGNFKTGITSTHTLKKLMKEIVNGTMANYLTVNGRPLIDNINMINAEIEMLKKRLGVDS
jgi:hypothetical protein